MKIRKVTNYKAPNYPNLTQILETPEIMNKLPKRWQSPSKWMMIMGISTLLTRYLAAEETTDSNFEVIVVPSEENSETSEKIEEPVEPNVQFAKILPEALAKDGRGTFGCVAMNPPTFLSESEALELIYTELTKAGLKLKEDVKIDNIECPNEDARWSRSKPKTIVGKYSFDYTSNDKSIIIEFVSLKDAKNWKMSNTMSSAPSYNLPKVVDEQMKKAFDNYPEKATVAFFFDPLVKPKRRWWGGANTKGIDDNEVEELINKEFGKKREQNSKKELIKKSKEKLRQQVAYFVKQLQESEKLAITETK